MPMNVVFKLQEEVRKLGLSLTLWQGMFEGKENIWVRWCDADGNLIPTGEERAINAEHRAAEAEAELAKLRAELLRQNSKTKRTK